MHRAESRMNPQTEGLGRLLTLTLVVALTALACSPNPSPRPSPTPPVPTPSPTAMPTPAPVAGIGWGEPVRLPGSHTRAGAASAVSYMGRIIVVATVATAAGFSIGVWTSADGVEWSFEVPEAMSNSRATGLIVGPEGLVLAGVRVEPGAGVIGPATAVRAAIWMSSDGRTWTDIAVGPEFEGRHIADLATDGSGILVVGNAPIASPGDEACPTAAIWRSTGGEIWQTVAPPEPCSRLSSVAGHDGRFVVLGTVADPTAAGTPGAPKSVAWLVKGDAPWERLDAVSPPGASYGFVDGPPGFLLVAGSSSTPPSVLYSADGEAWTATVAGDDFGRGPGNWAPLITLGFADAFYVKWVRQDAAGRLETALFRSPDGRAWSPVPPSAALDRSPTLTSVVLHEGRVIGLGGQAQILAWVSPPPASGPEPPTLLAPTVVETSIPGAGIARAVAFDGDTALAVGSEQDLATGTAQGRVWSWSEGAGWVTVEATGLDGASLSGLAHADAGWAATGSVARHLDGDPSKPLYPVATIWASSDGQRWTATPVGDPGGLHLMGIAAAGPGFVAIGTSSDASCEVAGPTSVVLTSPDGAVWTPVDDPDLECTQVNSVVAQDGRIVAVGASSRLVVTPAASSTPCDLNVCAGGNARVDGRPAAWVSDDGSEWSPVDGLDLGWSGRGFTSVAAGPGGYVANWVGDTLYVSPDGLTWTPTILPLGPSVVEARQVIGTKNGYLALGRTTTYGADGSGPFDRFSLYFSADGRTWQEVAPSAWSPDPGTYVSAMAGADGAAFLLIGARLGQQPAAMSWHIAVPGS